MKLPVLVGLLGLSVCVTARQDYSYEHVRAANSRKNRRFLKNLPGVAISVAFAGSNDMRQRLMESTELKLRQTRIPFQTNPFINPQGYPSLFLVFSNGTSCHAELYETVRLKRNNEPIDVTTWTAYWDVSSTKSVDSEEAAVRALEAAVNSFCNDWLAANPGGIRTKK